MNAKIRTTEANRIRRDIAFKKKKDMANRMLKKVKKIRSEDANLSPTAAVLLGVGLGWMLRDMR